MPWKVKLAMPVMVVLSACATENAMPEADEGAVLFAQNCAACHGSDAKGGVLADGQRAPDLTRIAERNGGVLPRAQVLSQIDGYGKGKAPASVMPEFGALLEGETVPVEVDGTLTPTPRPLAALLAYLESIQVSG
ncbi:cytochrome c [Ruegeria sp. 2205SS24-7]|uniref:c-type cytochrome n=1 Tax=Ruegeria discodermiae TaxID=3064389 RepID=UPI0027406D24|nr:cytochrome c [Ruegeria sp. 2205SS24-7]MDP5217877.1 cytochrome c [Ruegeria sp. 2205SS24-7]